MLLPTQHSGREHQLAPKHPEIRTPETPPNPIETGGTAQCAGLGPVDVQVWARLIQVMNKTLQYLEYGI